MKRGRRNRLGHLPARLEPDGRAFCRTRPGVLASGLPSPPVQPAPNSADLDGGTVSAVTYASAHVTAIGGPHRPRTAYYYFAYSTDQENWTIGPTGSFTLVAVILARRKSQKT